jgi:uncharacterized protein YndB with AHSA1/START domain
MHWWKDPMMNDGKLDLEITRLVAAPRAKVWRAWQDPEILKQWWCPKPWTTKVHAHDFRSGGAFHTFMSGPDGGESDNPGVFPRWCRWSASSGHRCSSRAGAPRRRGLP